MLICKNFKINIKMINLFEGEKYILTFHLGIQRVV